MTVFKFIKKIIMPFHLYLVGIAFTMMLLALDVALRPYLMGMIIDTASRNSSSPFTNLWVPALMYMGVQLCVPLVWSFYDYCCLKIEPKMRVEIGAFVMKRLLQSDVSFFYRNQSGAIASKMTDLFQRTPSLVVRVLDVYFVNFLSVILALIMLSRIHLGFACVMILWVTFLILFALSTAKTFNKLSKRTAEAMAQVTGASVDIFNNFFNVKIFSAHDHELKKYRTVQETYFQRMIERRLKVFKFYTGQGIGFGLYQSACLVMLVYLYQEGKVTSGDFATILAMNLGIIDGLWDLSCDIRNFSEDWGAVEQALDHLFVERQIFDHPEAKKLQVKHGQIEFKDVGFYYTKQRPIFAQQSLIIPPKQKVGLVGFSGGGKSTFVNLILRLFDVQQGVIYIDDQDVRLVTQDSLHKRIAVIPQEPTLFQATLMENIRYGCLDATDAQVMDAAKKARADVFIRSMPHGYETIIGEGARLSGGEKQRIAIARALLKEASILILDEPTSQLDAKTELQIQETLKEVMHDKTTLVIAHRLSTLMDMDRILVFNQGCIIQDGTYQELLQQSGLFQDLANAQIEGLLPDDESEVLEVQ